MTDSALDGNVTSLERFVHTYHGRISMTYPTRVVVIGATPAIPKALRRDGLHPYVLGSLARARPGAVSRIGFVARVVLLVPGRDALADVLHIRGVAPWWDVAMLHPDGDAAFGIAEWVALHRAGVLACVPPHPPRVAALAWAMVQRHGVAKLLDNPEKA